MKQKPHPGGQNRQQPVFTAQYRDHPIAKYNRLALIRALPVLPDLLTLQQMLTHLPQYSNEERNLDSSVRVLRLQEVFRIYVGFPRVAELMQTLHGMICEGYVGRAPYSPEDQALRQKVYEMQQRGDFFDLEDEESGAEFTAALVGIPGIGKTKAVKRITKLYRKVIYHPDLDIYQIPALLVEMPYNGVSINTLAHAIIRELDRMFPQGNYYRLYLAEREVAEVRFMDAVQLMQSHYVGILLVDESQNRDYRSKTSRSPSRAVSGQTPLTTLLITATNESEIPMLMTGTPELFDLLGVRMSMLRRTAGRGMRIWKPLSLPQIDSQGQVTDMGEFDTFLIMLWDYQWTKTAFELTPRIRNIFFYYTQGVTDIIIKLFHDVQLRAIRNGGDEVVDESLIHDVAKNELGAIGELTTALRTMNYDRTGQAADLEAYLRIDPHELNASRLEAQAGLVEVSQEYEELAAADEEDSLEVNSEDEAAAVEEPREVPTGKKAKQRAKPRSKKGTAVSKMSGSGTPTDGVASTSVTPNVDSPSTPPVRAKAPEIRPVDDVNEALGG